MGHYVRNLAVLAILAAGLLPAAAVAGPPTSKAEAESADSKAASTARKALDAGIKAYQAGKADFAIRTFKTALRGGLESRDMAQALYYRGLAYRKKGKPGLAISDLTSAIWLKDGLTEAQRQEAVNARIAAYREAGISDIPKLPEAQRVAKSTAPAAGSWQTAMDSSPAASAAAPPPPAPVAAAAPQTTAPPPPPAQQSSGSSGGITGFFSNVSNSVTNFFTGGSSSSSAPNANDGSVTTASLSSSADKQPPPAASWSGNTQVAVVSPPRNHASDVATPFETKVATATPTNASKRASRPPSGKYRLQVAAVRSRTEADTVAQRLVAEHGGELGPRAPIVDEAVIGSMGTFYRVRVGPYASAKEPQKLCRKLQASGFDCLVVTK